RAAELRRAEESAPELKHPAGRGAELEAERDRLCAERLSPASAAVFPCTTLFRSERAGAGAADPEAEAAIARGEEERRALVVAAERRGQERDNASAWLSEVLNRLEAAAAQVETLSRQLEVEREARRGQAAAAREEG